MARRRPLVGVRFVDFVVSEVGADSAGELRAALRLITRTDAVVLVRRLGRALEERGRRVYVRRDILVAVDSGGGEWPVVWDGVQFRWGDGAPVPPARDIQETAELIDRAMRRESGR
ncbi:MULTISPECIES: hypothetical protein [Actinomadura]|uniref:Uncharacterized protein n=1 Tax=Actinomadura miaoliensis TaxID=430685 RepID=A0ABP7WGI6_9ACTN